MSNTNEGNEPKTDVAQTQKADRPGKELTPQQIQKRKKMLVYPLLFLLFIGSMWLIFAPSGSKDERQPDGFNAELPIPKDETIVGDKRTAYQQEAMQDKQNEKMRSLQDFAFMLSQEEEDRRAQGVNTATVPSGNQKAQNNNRAQSGAAIQSSADAYRDVNRQLNDWYEPPVTNVNSRAQLEMEERVQELERKLAEKSAADEQLELIEKSYAIAAKYMPTAQGQVISERQQVQEAASSHSINNKVLAKPVSQVYQSVVSLLAAPIENDEFLEQYGKPRNMGFITAAGNETATDKNSIRASVYQTVTLSNGKELQLRLLEPMRAGNMLIPANTVLRGSAKIGGERLHITITSIGYANNIIPVEMEVYDMDGMQGIFVPNSDELNAMKEIAAGMGTSMGSSITITDNAGSQLASDLSRSVIQGASQYFSKKMREVKVTLKAGYNVLLLPKT